MSGPATPQTGELGAILCRLDELKTLPVVAHKLGDLVNDPRADVRSIARVLNTDQSLTAKVLRLANSSYYGIPGGVTSLVRAVSFLGFNTMHQLVLSVSVLSVLQGKGGVVIQPGALWQHSIGCAVFAEAIARRIGFADPDGCFTAGLLHDIGKVALLQIVPERFSQAVAVARAKGIGLRDAEAECGLPSHDTVGGTLAERWRFPMSLRVAIGHRHWTSSEMRAAAPANLAAFSDIVALANSMARLHGIGDPGDRLAPEPDHNLLARLNLSREQLPGLRDDMLRAVEKTRALQEILESVD